ncbi:hypothetical protein BT96DRAFT_140319 [Gymnopus androsaceus JB14]|uniref:Uncharacterized protein n=1 Tax=Gymnopus androsaceus JB14 TaxID=1447944 RepID=A0A6A4HCM5_9AGAR|nr:hypothetical protein BT96DRAFT_140319 [Gymnopus androsaceus JB14]
MGFLQRRPSMVNWKKNSYDAVTMIAGGFISSLLVLTAPPVPLSYKFSNIPYPTKRTQPSSFSSIKIKRKATSSCGAR